MLVLRPLAVALALAAGIACAALLDHAGVPPAARWTAAALVAIAAARARDDRSTGWLGAFAILLAGAGLGARHPRELTDVDDRVLDRIEGVVGSPVIATRTGAGARVGDVWVWTAAEPRCVKEGERRECEAEAIEALAPGETIAVTGYLRSARGARGVAQPDGQRALEARGARAELTAVTIERIADEPGAIDRVWRAARELQRAGTERLDHPVLAGIVLGDRRGIPVELDARWRALGIYHVLSVSGLHLAVIAGLAFTLLRRLAAALSHRVAAARVAGPPALAIALAYTLVTGAQVATLRALVAVAIVIVGLMLERPVRLLDAIGVAAIVLLATRPLDLFDPSFQLSFVAAIVLAIMPSAAPVERTATRRRRVARWLGRGIATSAVISLATAPITAHHFHEVTIGGLLGNVLFAPLVELVALPLALFGVAIDFEPAIAVAKAIVATIDAACAACADYVPLGKIALASPIVATLLVALALLVVTGRRRGLALVATCTLWSSAPETAELGALRVTFVDVGQGDAAIVETPTGEVWLIDAGGDANARDPAAPGRAISRILRTRGIDRIALAVISHPHPDHYLGLAGIDVPIDRLWAAREDIPRGIFTFATAPPLGLAHHAGEVQLEVLAPRFEGEPIATVDPVRSVNDNSLVVAVRYRGRTLLFTGDLEAEGEAALVAPRADLVKVPHHGSPTSSTQALVDATRPAYAVISCGRGNRFGFPSLDVVARWTAAGADVLRTDRTGSITVTVNWAGAIEVE